MRVLSGGFTGAVVGAVLLAVAAARGLDAMWMALPVGVICGLSVSMMARGEGNCFFRGGVAALALLLAVIGGKLGVVAFLKSQDETRVIGATESVARVTPPAPPTGEAHEADSEEEASEAPEAESEAGEEEAPARLAEPSPKPLHMSLHTMSSMNQLTSNDYSLFDGIWLAVSALVAYQLGKGRPPMPSTQEYRAPDEPEPDEK